MPMSATEMERKIHQLDNDVSEIYTMIADVQNTQRRHSNRFSEIGSRLDQLLDRQTAVEGGMGRLDGRMDGLEGRMDGLDGRMDGLQNRMDGLEGRMDGLDGRMDRLDGRMGTIETQLGEVLTILRGGEG